MSSSKVFVIGLDGMDPSLTKKYMDQGKMPNVKKLVEAGACREDLVMLGGHPTVTPPMWTTLATGANPVLVAVLMIFALSSALATPGASSRAGLVFGNSEWISTGQAYFQGIISVVCVIIALLCVGVPLGMMIL